MMKQINVGHFKHGEVVFLKQIYLKLIHTINYTYLKCVIW